jgi:hypothetical protein
MLKSREHQVVNSSLILGKTEEVCFSVTVFIWPERINGVSQRCNLSLKIIWLNLHPHI